MQIQYFSIYDSVAQIYGSLFAAPTPGAAQRMFEDSVKNPETPHNKHSHDYALYQVAVFDDNAGLVEPLNPPIFLVKGSSLLPE